MNIGVITNQLKVTLLINFLKTLGTWIISLGIMMTKPEFYLVRRKVGAGLGLVFGQSWDPAVDILTQIQQRYLKP